MRFLWMLILMAHTAMAEIDTELEKDVFEVEAFQIGKLEKQIVSGIQHRPDSAYHHYLLSRLYLRISAGRDDIMIKKAVSLAQQALNLAPKKDLGYVGLAAVFDALGQTEKATEILNEALNSDVQPKWRLQLTLAQIGNQPREKQLTRLRNAIALPEAKKSLIVPYAIALITANNESQLALEELKRWQRNWPHKLVKIQIGNLLSSLKNPKGAETVFKELSDSHPTFMEARLNLAIVQYRDLGNPVGAIQNFKAALAHKSLSDTLKGNALTHLGAAYWSNKMPTQAEGAFLSSLHYAHDPYYSFLFIVDWYKQHDAISQFRPLFQEIADIIPGDARVHAIHGELLSLNLGQHREAIYWFHNAITLDPNNGDYYNATGLAFYRMGNLQDALALFSHAVKVNPNDASALYNQACMLARLGRTGQAITSLDKAVSIDPTYAEHAATDKDLASLKSDLRFQQIIERAALLAH